MLSRTYKTTNHIVRVAFYHWTNKERRVISCLVDMVRKIAGWKERNFLIGGKKAILKSVAQAMPMYVPNIFMSQDRIINEIH